MIHWTTLACTGLLLAGAQFVVCPLGAAEQPEKIDLSEGERERCLAILRSGLASDEFWPSMHAAEALTLAGQQAEVITALKSRLPQETNDQRRCGLARELVRAGDRSALPVLVSILGDKSSNGRVHAAESLYKLGESTHDSTLVHAYTQKEDTHLRLMAAGALARLGCKSALTMLRKHLSSEESTARITVCFILAKLGRASDIPALQERLKTETDPIAKAYAINALACLGDPEGRAALKSLLESSDVGVCASAAEHVGHARCFEHRARLVELLDSPALDVRIRAAQSLFALSQAPIVSKG